jgi:hypothetical protein
MAGMAPLDSVKQKLYRAKHHIEELYEALRTFYRGDPVKLRFSGGALHIGADCPVPARFGLIAGDVLQNMRSCLDYLVWELLRRA